VALRSPRRGRVARRSPSIAIVGRRLLGRFLLGDTASDELLSAIEIRTPAFRVAVGQTIQIVTALVMVGDTGRK
jgi:hypothetical protein